VLEHPEQLLTVNDSEVTVEKVLTAAEKLAKEEAARKVFNLFRNNLLLGFNFSHFHLARKFNINFHILI
jgi:hypothetical protein